MRAVFYTTPLSVLFALGSAAAATAQNVMGLGLSELHWGMSQQEVQAAYSALGWHQIPQNPFELAANYNAFGCMFTITATFVGHQSPGLRRVILDSHDVGCSQDVQMSLIQQFGGAEQKTSFLGVVSRNWRFGLNNIGFEQYPDGWLHQPTRISVVFADLTDAVYLSQ